MGETRERSPKDQLDGFIDRFTPEVAALARRALRKMRKLTPGALELVYDNYNALVIAFGPTERASELIFSIALYPRYPTLFFGQGAKLPDPTKRLRGSGTSVRHIVLEDVDLLDEPDVRALIDVALARAKVPLDPGQRRRLVIRSISPKQRPRRPKGR
ncbi:MAG TPA: hypothetical protein VGL81_01665 [Polyangiaceae bacterium]|jgi:hypothetical protein